MLLLEINKKFQVLNYQCTFGNKLVNTLMIKKLTRQLADQVLSWNMDTELAIADTMATEDL